MTRFYVIQRIYLPKHSTYPTRELARVDVVLSILLHACLAVITVGIEIPGVPACRPVESS